MEIYFLNEKLIGYDILFLTQIAQFQAAAIKEIIFPILQQTLSYGVRNSKSAVIKKTFPKYYAFA